MLRGAAIAGVGLAATGGTAEAGAEPQRRGKSMIGVPFEGVENPRFGVIGLGNRGGGMLPLLLQVPGAKVSALCDIRPEFAQAAATMVTAAGQPEPAIYTDGDEDFENLVKRDDIDFVYIATPWEWHTPMALAAMRAGKHVGAECPIGLTIKDLWELVDTSERTRRHCIQLENCCYGQNELRALRMAHEGACSASCCTAPAPTCTTCVSCCSRRPTTRTSGAGSSTPPPTATCTRRTASAPSPPTWTSTAATGSSASRR
jgi:hypothetical protein